MPRTKPQNMATKGSSSTTWDDVAGVDEVRAELNEVVDFLRDPKRFEALGAKVPKGLLLYGPPGTGKTMLAKAVAHESGANFYSASAASFVEMFAGLGAARIRKLFAEARKNAPAIIFIDELDAVGAQRTGHGFNREQDQTLNQLLVELDGFDGAKQVVVMGASNRIEDLDQALLRPGRFDRQMLVPPPDLAGREAILAVHTRGKPLDADASLATIARQTSGLTGAELANVCNEAAIGAGRRGDSVIIAGRLRRGARARRRRPPAEEGADREGALNPRLSRGRPRAHGAPHGRRLGAAEGDDRRSRHGARLHVPSARGGPLPPHEGGAQDWMVVALAGRAAEEVVFGRVTNGAANDLEKVTDIARHMVFDWGMSDAVTSRTMRADNYALSEATKQLRDDAQAQLTDGAYAESIRLVTKHRAPLDRIAAALLEKETLVRDEVLELFKDVEQESSASETVGVPRVVATVYGTPWP